MYLGSPFQVWHPPVFHYQLLTLLYSASQILNIRASSCFSLFCILKALRLGFKFFDRLNDILLVCEPLIFDQV